ncbi:MAG: DUF1343 domain-containing protein [Gemmatimonadaceae bacterium]
MRHLGPLGGWTRIKRGIVSGALLGLSLGVMQACHNGRTPDTEPAREMPDGTVRPEQRRPVRVGLSVLMDDSLRLVTGKRVGLITNQTGVDERGRSGIDLLSADPRAVKAGVKLVALFSPEHGIRGTEDKANVANSKDVKSGVPIYSLYGATTVAPPDSVLKNLDVLVIDLQDIGIRTWTYVGVMVYAMRAAGRNNVPVLVLDRPNPLTGTHTEGAMLDTNLANPEESTPQKRANGFALWPMPLRHGLTMGELALFYKATLGLNTQLHVIPMRNWRRSMWYDQTGISFVKPSPNLPNLNSTLLYGALVPFEATNISVGRGTSEPFQHFGAPWLRADTLVKLLEDLGITGVKFHTDRFTPVRPGDSKYGGQNIPGVRIEIINRELVQPGRIGAAILWAVNKLNHDSLVVRPEAFDERQGAASVRKALMSGVDPDAAMDRQLAMAVAFERDTRKYRLYR